MASNKVPHDRFFKFTRSSMFGTTVFLLMSAPGRVQGHRGGGKRRQCPRGPWTLGGPRALGGPTQMML